MSHHVEVLIVGAGTTGLTLAYELARRNVSCRIIDKYVQPPESSRALGVQARTVEVFDNLGILDDVVKISSPIAGRVMIAQGQEVLRQDVDFYHDLDGLPDQPKYGFVCANQSLIEKILREKLAQWGVRVEMNCKLESLEDSSYGVLAVISHGDTGELENVQAQWVVGCDGSHSTVRKLLDLTFEGKDYPGYIALADVYLDIDVPSNHVVMWSFADGMVFAVPYRDHKLWRITTYRSRNEDGTIPKASLELFQHLLAEEAGDKVSQITGATWMSNFAIRHRMVDRYRKGHVFVAGDATHVHSPAGGQGMNTGIQDAYNMGWKLALVVHGDAPESLLDTYGEERIPVAKEVLNFADSYHQQGFFRGMTAQDILSGTYSFFESSLERGSQLAINYQSSSLSHTVDNTRDAHNKLVAGDRAPNGVLIDRCGERTTLYAYFRSPQFRLLVFQGKHKDCSEDDLIAVARHYVSDQIISVIIATDRELPGKDTEVDSGYDVENYLHSCYGVNGATVFVIRPDGYIGLRVPIAAVAEVGSYMQRCYGIEMCAPVLSSQE